MEFKKITNQQIYDTLYSYFKNFDCHVALGGGLLGDNGQRGFTGQMFNLDQIERLEALSNDWAFLWKVIDSFFEDTTYICLIHDMEENVPNSMDGDYMGLYDPNPYWHDHTGEIQGCEMALLDDLNSFSRNPIFNIKVKPV